MPIRLKLAPEPFCGPGTGYGESSTNDSFARSPAYEQLLSEVIRYCEGEIEGRAFLISGYRGAGKSTLARRAVEQAQRQLRSQGRSVKPIFVRLHGPDLLPPDDNGPDTEIVLKQVTIAIWRALADEFASSFEMVLSAGSYMKLARGPRMFWRDQMELAAQFRMDMDGGPGTAALRSYWERSGRINSGILFGSPRDPSQAFAEIVALSSAAQAYRRVSGKESQSETQAANTGQKSSLGAKFESKQIITPLLSLGSGAAVGAAVMASSFGKVGGTVAGSIAAILSAFVLESSWTSERTANQEITFLPDTTVASLDRMLPSLIQRIRMAGLAPIFVVDELDKVDRLFDRMRKLVKHLKHFVTERAFFCFVTDKSYFEQ